MKGLEEELISNRFINPFSRPIPFCWEWEEVAKIFNLNPCMVSRIVSYKRRGRV